MVDELAILGLFVVPVGALEGWAPEIGAHGPAFVQRAFTAKVHEESAALKTFARGIDAFLSETNQAAQT